MIQQVRQVFELVLRGRYVRGVVLRGVTCMRKIVVVFLFVLLPRTAKAVPTGCFYTDYGTSCYSSYFLSADCDQWNMTSYNFGNYVKSMCDYVNSIESTNSSYVSTIVQCRDALVTVATQRDNADALVAATEQNRQEWIGYAGKRDKLIKRLYKACGSKCKRIK